MLSTKSQANLALLIGATIAMALLPAASAQAKYTAEDRVEKGIDPDTGKPFVDAQGNIITVRLIITYEGYCDTQFGIGQECGAAYTLPYSVDFGMGATNQVSLRDDGTLQFVGSLIPGVDSSATQQFVVLRNFDTGKPGPTPPVSFEPQLARIAISDAKIEATWFFCSTTAICYDSHKLTLTPMQGGYRVAGSIGPEFVSATFDPPRPGVPEPSAWALMILGFGAIGSALRRKRLQATLARS